MNATLALTDVLRVEDSPELLSIRCRRTGVPLWTTIRFAFLRAIIGDLLYGAAIVGPPAARSSRFTAAGKALKLAGSVVHNQAWMLAHRNEFPVAVMPTGARLVRREGRFFNCLSDHFVAALPQRTVAVESMFEWRWPFPRYHRNTLVHTPLLLAAAYRGRRGAAEYAQDARALVALAASRAKDLLDWDLGESRRAWLEGRCAEDASSLQPRLEAYLDLFRRLGTRVVVKEEACYGGGDNAAIMLAARHLGIRTAEYQHGLISAGHDAYNYAPAVRESKAYAEILPDHLLTYGCWWGEQINVPAAKVPVGNPHRSEMLAGRSAGPRRSALLVLGDGLDTALYLDLCEQLARSAGPSCEVVFRPHPLERAAVLAAGLGKCEGLIRLDVGPDIYDSFREVDAVVSEVSTGLFEAIGLVPRIFVWDTPKARFTIPAHPFAGFTEAAELAGLLRDPSAGRVGANEAEAVWAPEWRANYLRFMEGITQ